jgi:hypothetical protein
MLVVRRRGYSLSIIRIRPSPETTGPFTVTATYPKAISLARLAGNIVVADIVSANSIDEANSSGVKCFGAGTVTSELTRTLS